MTVFSSNAPILITGAAGNLGTKLRQHWQATHRLRLVDVDSRGDASIVRADLSHWDEAWTARFRDVHTVVHLAGDPVAYRSWAELVAPNLDALANVFIAAAKAGVTRVIFASSNHVMGGLD